MPSSLPRKLYLPVFRSPHQRNHAPGFGGISGQKMEVRSGTKETSSAAESKPKPEKYGAVQSPRLEKDKLKNKEKKNKINQQLRRDSVL